MPCPSLLGVFIGHTGARKSCEQVLLMKTSFLLYCSNNTEHVMKGGTLQQPFKGKLCLCYLQTGCPSWMLEAPAGFSAPRCRGLPAWKGSDTEARKHCSLSDWSLRVCKVIDTHYG